MEIKPTIEELDEKCALCGEYNLIKFIDKDEPIWCPMCTQRGLPNEWQRRPQKTAAPSDGQTGKVCESSEGER